MSEITPNSLVRLKIMAALPMISGPLSLMGSSLIIYLILKDWKRTLSGAYHRILFGFSIFDILGSFGMSMSTLPSPAGTPGIWGAIGNSRTCTAQGFFLQTGVAVIYYNALLMLHYLLSVRYNVSEIVFRKRIESYAHILVISLALIPSIIAASLGWFNNIGNICFIGPYPKGCRFNSEMECERGDNAYIFMWVCSGLFVIMSVAFLPISLLMLTWTLVSQEKKMQQKYMFRSDNNLNCLPTNFISSNVISSQTDCVIDIKRRSKSRIILSSLKLRRVRNQAMCYAGAAFITLTPLILSRIFHPFIVRCLVQFFFPFQGFFNFINYVRPRVSRLQKHELAKSWLHAALLIICVSEDTLKKRKLQKQSRQACQDRLRSIRNESGDSKKI